MRVFINAIIVHTFLNLYVFWRGWKVLPPKYAYRIPFVAIFLIELGIYLTGFVGVDELSMDILYPIMKLGTSWMIFILYMTFMLLAYDVVQFIQPKIKSLNKRIILKSLKIREKYYLASILIVISMLFYGHYRFWHPVVNEVEIPIAKQANVDELKVVMVADVHVGYMINREILKMYVDKIMEQKPDMILLVGDIIDYDLYPLEKEHMEEEFHRLKAPYGVFAATGNHEYRLNAEEKISWLSEKAGLTVLRDSVAKVDDLLYIVGREDDKFEDRKELKDLMTQVDRSRPVIVMNHEPRRLSEESDEKVDLAVFGHTHNGQLFPYNFVIGMIYEVGHGYKKKDDTHIYVTSGLGLSGPQFRIGTISEIVVLNLKFNQ